MPVGESKSRRAANAPRTEDSRHNKMVFFMTQDPQLTQFVTTTIIPD
jgi:hypothetical protein